jgi:hypothetical protein
MCLHNPASESFSFVSLVLRHLTRQMGHVVIRLGFRFRREETSQLSPDRLDLLTVGLGRVLALVDCNSDTMTVTAPSAVDVHNSGQGLKLSFHFLKL